MQAALQAAISHLSGGPSVFNTIKAVLPSKQAPKTVAPTDHHVTSSTAPAVEPPAGDPPAGVTPAVPNAFITTSSGDANAAQAGSQKPQDATSVPNTPTHPRSASTPSEFELTSEGDLPANTAADAAVDAAAARNAAATTQLNKLMEVGANLSKAAQTKYEDAASRSRVAAAEAAGAANAVAADMTNGEVADADMANAEVADAEAAGVADGEAAAPAGTSLTYTAFKACVKCIMRLTEAAEEPGMAESSDYEHILPLCSSAADNLLGGILSEVFAELLTMVDAQEQLGNLALAIQLLYPVSLTFCIQHATSPTPSRLWTPFCPA